MIVAAIAIAICIAIVATLNAKQWGSTAAGYYQKHVMTEPEQILYYRLVAAHPTAMVLAQVGLSRVLGVKSGKGQRSGFARISQKSLDFVICKPDASIVAVIELDDASHRAKHRQYADRVKDAALMSAGINVIRWNVRALPSVDEIKDAIPANALVFPQDATP